MNSRVRGADGWAYDLRTRPSAGPTGCTTRTVVGYDEETIARFTTGDLDIESDWDDYLAELENMGLAQLIEMTQKVHDRQFK